MTSTGAPDAPVPWHSLAVEDALARTGARREGLTGDEVKERLGRFGPNRLPRAPLPPPWRVFLGQFQSPLIYILLAAAVVSLVMGQGKDAAFIGAILVINAIIGTWQELRAQTGSRALENLLRIRARVQRDGEVVEVDGEEVVPGDVVWLESGDRLPADLRLLHAQGLEVDESVLTGESMAVNKDAGAVLPVDTPLAEHAAMGYAGAVVARGRGRGVVVATGAHTVVGRLAVDVMALGGGKAPLLVRMERFSRVVGVAMVAASAVLGLVGMGLHGLPVREVFLFAVALAVAAIPEGLPVAITVALAVAASRMAGRGVIVRRLDAVEGLGSCTLIASDKTGTLTCNELTVKEIRSAGCGVLSVSGAGFTPEGEVTDDLGRTAVVEGVLADLVRVAVLCNEGVLSRKDDQWHWRGDPTDVALLVMARKLGMTRENQLARHPLLAEIPFEPERQFAATFHDTPDASQVAVKGSPERVLAMCVFDDDTEHRQAMEQAHAMAENGLRVLAFAQGAGALAGGVPTVPQGLTFLGFVGMMDPLRPGAAEAVARCHHAGLSVWMVTGDHPRTALALSRQLGLARDPSQVVTGQQLAEASPDRVRELVTQARVFARVTPAQKLQLVQVAQQAGHFVAVTGDGVNDAPALKAANIGVAMGKQGTDVARDAARLVISDDNFATIVAGVEEGRVAYDNVRKVIFLLVTTGAAELLLVTLAMLWRLPLPLLATQLLWLNLVTNGIQDVALAFEPGEGGILARPPRPVKEGIFNRLMVQRVVLNAVVMAVVCFGAFTWMLRGGYGAEAARNVVFSLMVLFEVVLIGNSRSETKSLLALSPLKSPLLLWGTVVALLVHVSAQYTPFGRSVLAMTPLSGMQWLGLLVLALSLLVVSEVHKWWWRSGAPAGERSLP